MQKRAQEAVMWAAVLGAVALAVAAGYWFGPDNLAASAKAEHEHDGLPCAFCAAAHTPGGFDAQIKVYDRVLAERNAELKRRAATGQTPPAPR